MSDTYKQASHQHQRTLARIHGANPARIIKFAVFALTVPGLVSLAQTQSAPTAAAATAVTTTGGSANRVAKFSGATTIVNSAITEVNGNVGINSTTPTQPLFVNGNIQAGGTGALLVGGSIRISSLGIILGGSGSAAAPGLSFANNAATGLFNPGAGIIGFSTGGFERMRLNSNGFLGIGTASPTSPLTVAGTIQSTTGGFKFPDGSVQTTAAGAAGQIVHDSTLIGTGSARSPLGVADPFFISDDVISSGAAITGQVFAAGVTGVSGQASASGIGVSGFSGGTGVFVPSGVGVFGNGPFGMFASARGFSNGGIGIEGIADNSAPGDIGVLGISVSPGLAGEFSGDVSVFGNLSKSAGSFKIDHPLAPGDKYLYHSFVESPDMMNIYNGMVTTDMRGMAVVTMPEYFSALNRDFRYQLTTIGQFAQAIVAQKLNNNQFMIQTDKPNVEVSWQVTGVRQDAWANAHRIPVEQDKDEKERGHYLHPELYDHPKEDAVIYLQHPELLKQLGSH